MNKLSYALGGMSMASNLMNSGGLRELDVDSFVKAFTDVMSNTNLSMSPQEANEVIQSYFRKKRR